MAYLYMATNVINGHRYIGITSRTVDIRRIQHTRNAIAGETGCTRFWAAIRKYGADAFQWQTLANFSSIEDAKAAEIEAIADRCPEYNVSPGGDFCSAAAWNRMPIICLEDGLVFQSMTAASRHYAIDVSDIAKATKGDGRRLSVHARHFARHETPMTAAERAQTLAALPVKASLLRRVKRRSSDGQLADAHTGVTGGRDRKGRSAAGPMTQSRRVVCMDDDLAFPSAKAAARHYDVAASALIELCLGKRGRKTVGGKRFCYAE